MLTNHLFRFDVVLGVLDTQATADSPGYDAQSNEPLLEYDAAGNRVAKRGEREVRVRCLVETGTLEQPQRTALGLDGSSRLGLVFRAQHLREAGLLDDKGKSTIKFGARLKQVYHRKSGLLQDDYEQLDAGGNVTGGIYVTDVVRSDYGFNGERDLFVAQLADRPNAPAAAG